MTLASRVLRALVDELGIAAVEAELERVRGEAGANESHVVFLRGVYRGLSRAADEAQERAHAYEGGVIRARQEDDEGTVLWYRGRADVARDIEKRIRERMEKTQKQIGDALADEEPR